MARTIGIVGTLLTLGGLLTLGACTTYQGGVVETEPGSYFVRARTGSIMFGELGASRRTVEEQAYRHCGDMDLEVSILNANAERTQTMHAHFVTLTLAFQCAEAVEWNV